MPSGVNINVDVTRLLLPARKSCLLEMTWWIEILGAKLNNGVNTCLQANEAVIKANVISGCSSWLFQCSWGAAHAVTQVRSPGVCSVFLVTLTQGKRS